MNIVYQELSKIINDEKPKFWLHALAKTLETLNVESDVCHQAVELLKVSKELKNKDDLDFDINTCTVDDLASPKVFDQEVSLNKICDIKNINALSEDTELDFSKNGITVIYGDNGAGKSGYVRILRMMCRFRGELFKILPNLYKSNGGKIDATIHYNLNKTHLEEYKLSLSSLDRSILKNVSVFDSDSATAYIEKKNEVAFRPFVLNVLVSLPLNS